MKEDKEIALNIFNQYMVNLDYINVEIISDKNKKEHLLTFRFKDNESK